MRLRDFRVRGFRCVRDSGTIGVKDIVALIGRNESGKTSILSALLLLNKDSAIIDVDLTDGLEDEMAATGFRIVEGRFELSPDESAAIAQIGGGFPVLPHITIYRDSNSLQPSYDFGVTEFPTVFRFQEEIQPQFAEYFTGYLEAIKALVGSKRSVGVTLTGADLVMNQMVVVELEQLIGSLESVSLARPTRDEVERICGKLQNVGFESELDVETRLLRDNTVEAAKRLYQEFNGRSEVENLVRGKLHPRFVYFSSYKTIYGAIKLSEFLSDPGTLLPEKLDSGESLDKRETIENLFFLAGLDAQRLEGLKNKIASQNKYLLQCSQKLTEEIKKTWVREDGTTVFCEFQYGDDVVRIRVSDVHSDGSQTNKQLLQRRSEGFRWHFSFQVNFRAETKKAELREAILLLDEPGLHLHPAQQEQLLYIIRELSKDNQILYTTHSPFMIFNYDEGNLLLVETDAQTHLSRVNPAFWNGDPTAIIPILHSLGAKAVQSAVDAEFARALPPILVVEGGTDYQYVKAFNWLFRRQQEDGVSKRVTLNCDMVPANGSPGIAPSALFNRQIGHEVVVLYDNEPDAKRHGEELKKQQFPQERILFVECDGKAECDIEDMFSEGFYLKAVNEVYKVVLKSSKYTIIEKSDLKAFRQKNSSVSRIVLILEKIWESHRADGWGTFSKMAVCEKICVDMLQSGKVEETIAANFQKLFERIVSATAPAQTAPI